MGNSFQPCPRQTVQANFITEPNRSRARAAHHRLLRLRNLVPLGVAVAIILPMLIRHVSTGISITQPTQYNTALGGMIALIFGILGYRRLHVFPGIATGSYVFMSLTATFGILAVAFFLARIEYSRVQFLSSYLLSLGVYLYIHQKIVLHRRLRLGVVPSAATENLPSLAQVDWMTLGINDDTPLDVDAIVVDLHTDHEDAWHAKITSFVLKGIPVYHYKQAIEQMSGRVEIYHLFENTLGSLNPNDNYIKLKAIADAMIAGVLLVLLAPILAIVGALVRLDSPGPALFRQERIGYRGKQFTVYKVRTMRIADVGVPTSDEQLRHAAMTKMGDSRITRFGRFLRRTRLDELPQLFNIFKGEMSLIGPRPEAVALSRWYEKEIPFYHYRHLIKPGLTGWAQINQGHVIDVVDVQEKLHLDFYYVKNFSFWLDVLIAVRTVRIIVSGHGAL